MQTSLKGLHISMILFIYKKIGLKRTHCNIYKVHAEKNLGLSFSNINQVLYTNLECTAQKLVFKKRRVTQIHALQNYKK